MNLCIQLKSNYISGSNHFSLLSSPWKWILSNCTWYCEGGNGRIVVQIVVSPVKYVITGWIALLSYTAENCSHMHTIFHPQRGLRVCTREARRSSTSLSKTKLMICVNSLSRAVPTTSTSTVKVNPKASRRTEHKKRKLEMTAIKKRLTNYHDFLLCTH